ncbi:hypothetical protein [Bosea sp. MMO-172]|uniref:hypothetical protein n=1 Tax=Bosea sp. MMO-172 TaxID=3127885 RepID=UPI003017389A
MGDEREGIGGAEHPILHIQLNADGVVAPARQAAATVAEVVAGCLRAFEAGELARPAPLAGFSAVIDLGMPDLAPEARHSLYSNWLVAKGFQDLLRGVRASLEEALLFIALMGYEPKLTTVGAIEEFVAQTRKTASGLKFPALLERIHRGLKLPLIYGAEVQSLQSARNCLEHRNGIVGQGDVDPITQALTISFPRMKVFYERDGQELEIMPNAVVDAGEEKAEVQIYMRRDIATKSFALGERIEFSVPEFIEIAMSCMIFAADLAGKLPSGTRAVPPRGTDES